MTVNRSMVTGAAIAGGQGRRMGDRDKGLVEYRGLLLVSHAVAALSQVAETVVINANRNLEAYGRLGCRVVADETNDFQGPLAGILAAMKVAKTPYLVTLPCDVPLVDGAMLTRLLETMTEQSAEICVAHDGKRLHPLVMAVECRLASSVQAFLASGERKVQAWFGLHRWVAVDFTDCPERFANVNTLDDLAALDRIR
jgi:molybdopterin-guanine dinucleotide biosynthesis protein A